MEQELRISQRAKQYPASGIRKMFDLAAQYPEAIKLTVGEPNFDTPQYIKDAAKRALDEGQTHYAPNAGTTELREAVAAKYRKQYWEGYTKDHVIITVGAMEGLFLAMMTLLDPGDEILVPDPCFPNYYGQASSIGARAVPVPTYEEYDYRIQAADIEKAVTPRTRAILLNSPCNPTGAVLTKEDILAIAKVAKTHDLWVLTDEPYDAIVYDGIQPYSMAQVPEMQDRVMVLNSFSKSYAMTGWRIGYLVAPEPGYIKKMAQLQEGVASCVSTFTQAAAVEALEGATLVSIHQNSYPQSRYHGTQVFFAPTEGSQQLAEAIQQGVQGTLQLENRRAAKQIAGNVYLMNHVDNRAVLVECGFLSNPEEERALRDPEYQTRMAAVLAWVCLMDKGAVPS